MVDRNVVFNLKDQTVEIYSGVKCIDDSSLEIPLYLDDRQSQINYVPAIFQ